jgi:hypothetical protein
MDGRRARIGQGVTGTGRGGGKAGGNGGSFQMVFTARRVRAHSPHQDLSRKRESSQRQ